MGELNKTGDECKKGGVSCAICNSFPRALKFICAAPRGLSANWEIWREVFIVGFAMLAIGAIAATEIYVFTFGPNSPIKDVPESLRNLLTLLTGYLFAYIPTSFAAQSAEKSRRESDSRLQEVLNVINTLSVQIRDLQQELDDLIQVFTVASGENQIYDDESGRVPGRGPGEHKNDEI
jgi:hypothetical protein